MKIHLIKIMLSANLQHIYTFNY